jgi:lysozyme
MRKKRTYILDLFLLFVLGLLWWKPFVFNISSSFQVAIPLEKNSFGIDVSHHQGKVNWDTLINNKNITPSIDFVFIKATEGLNHVDNELKYNINSLKNKKIPFGTYHFFLPEKSSIKQSNHFVKYGQLDKTNLPPVLDVEVISNTHEALTDSVKTWLTSVEKHSGKRPIIYCSWSFYKEYFSTDFEMYKFWIARYSNSIHFNDHPNILYWQFTDIGKLPIHNTDIDLNVSPIEFN